MVKISVIMPVYNAAPYIKNAVLSISNQTLKDLELICVNDGSTDNTLEEINNLKNRFDFIKVFSQENQGSGKARNYGISQASGEYIAFLDADDRFIDNDALEKMYFYGVKTDADMVGGNLKRINLDGSLDKYYDFENTDFKYFDKKDVILPIEYGIPFAFYKNIYKKEMLDKFKIEFPDLSRGQDPIFLANILTKINEIPVLNTDLYGYNKNFAGGVNYKVNTYQKKYDYIKHFKDTLDILKENDFDSAYEGYKREFIKYVTFEDNLYDEDFKKIIPDVFGDINNYFDEDSYGYNYLDIIVNDENLDEVNKELINFSDIKQFFFEETLINDNFIDPDYLREYALLISKNSDKKGYIEKLSFNSLKTVERHVNEDRDYLSSDIYEIKDQILNLNENPQEVLDSDVWKLSKFIETMKHFYKKW